jgi:hypothetical protein
MKSGTTLALAVSLGAAGVFAYLYLSHRPEAVAPAEAEESTAATAEPERIADEGRASPGAENEADAPTPKARKTPARPDTPLGHAVALQSPSARVHALQQIAEQADVAQLRALIAEARTFGVPADRRDALEVLLVRWFEEDPESAPRQILEQTLNEPSRVARSDTLASIGQAWAQISAESAWSYANRIPDVSARATFQRAILGTWSERDPEAALRGVIALPAGPRKDRMLRQAAAYYVRTDPQRALQIATSSKRADGRYLVMGIVTEWAEYDVRAAAQWLAANPGRVNRNIAGQFADRYGAVDPVEAIAWAQRMDRSGMRGLVGAALAGYAEVDPQDALRLAYGLENGAQRRRAVSAVLGIVAQRDPEYAKGQLGKLESEARSDAVQAIATAMMRADPRGTVEWLKTIDDGNARRQGLSSVAHMLADSDPETAAALTDEVPADARVAWISAVASGMAAMDPEAAMRWVRNYQSEPGYPQISAAFVQRLSMYEPEAAYEFAASLPDARQRDQMMMRALSNGPIRNPEVAARWMERIGDERLRAQVVQNIASQWAWQDSSGARRWASSLPSGPMRDNAISAIISASAKSVEDVTSMLGQIQSDDRRKDAVWQSAIRLAENDLEGVRTLLRRYPLDPARREQLATHVQEQYGVTL